MLLEDLPDDLLAVVAGAIRTPMMRNNAERLEKSKCGRAMLAWPVIHGNLLLSCRRWRRIIEALHMWPSLVESLSVSYPFRPQPHNEWQDYRQLSSLPEEFQDPRYDFKFLISSDIANKWYQFQGCFPLSSRWQLLPPYRQYAALLNHLIKVEARLFQQIHAAATGLEPLFVAIAKRLVESFPSRSPLEEAVGGGLRTPELEKYCCQEAGFYAVQWFIYDGWDHHGPGFTDALDILAGGWQAVNWQDTVVRENLQEAFEGHFCTSYRSAIGVWDAEDGDSADGSDDDATDEDEDEESAGEDGSDGDANSSGSAGD